MIPDHYLAEIDHRAGIRGDSRDDVIVDLIMDGFTHWIERGYEPKYFRPYTHAPVEGEP